MTAPDEPSGEEDAGLVRRAREGDRDAFERLVRRHLAAARRVAVGTAGDPHDADDICQEAFLKALRRLEDCRHPERFGSWLLAIVRNTSLNALDRGRRSRTEPLDAAGQVPAPGGADEDLERETLRDDLRRAVETLPEMQRRVLLLHDYEGWTHREIAARLEIAAGTSRYHLHAARRSMRSALGRYGDEEPRP